MTSIWRLLAESWPLVMPRARMRELVGADELRALERAAVLRAEPIGPGDGYPCRCHAEAGCRMRLVDEGALVAVCELAPAQCADEVVPDEDAVRLHVDAVSLVPVVQRALRLPRGPVVERAGVSWLGERRVGGAELGMVLVPRPERWLREGGLQRAVDEAPDRVLVLLTFDPSSVSPGAPRRVAGTRVAWVTLAEALYLEVPAVDLADLLLAVAPGAELEAELWPRYTFVADPERSRFAYAGRPLALDRSPLAARLLATLLQHGGRWVPRSELLPVLWPDDFGRRKAPDLDALDRRLRQVKSELSAAFVALPPVPGVVRDPVENLRTRSDTDGGYRIDVEVGRVLWGSSANLGARAADGD